MSTNLEPTPITPTTDTTLLSELCPFCNESPPKYRCPACDARTCSLKCSKRHKAYKQCSGTRDPAAFIKRSKLATPTALNRDFNFLTGVERVVTRGLEIPTEDQQEGGKNVEQKRKQATQAREAWIDRSGVVVKRAPQGLKRSRENKTDVVKTKKARLLHWTVEWILCDEGNKRVLDDRVMETMKLTSAFFHPNNAESRKKSKPEMTKTRFYLKKVGTPANKPTLIPLDPAAELKDCIKGRTVEEYPTIYVTVKEGHPEGYEVEYSITAGAGGKLEVLEETSTGDVVVRLGELEELLTGDRQVKPKEPEHVIPADSGIKVEAPGEKQNELPGDSGTRVKRDSLPVGHLDEGITAKAWEGDIEGSNEDKTMGQDKLLKGTLLELIGANGVGVSMVEGSRENGNGEGPAKDEAGARDVLSGETDGV